MNKTLYPLLCKCLHIYDFPVPGTSPHIINLLLVSICSLIISSISYLFFTVPVLLVYLVILGNMLTYLQNCLYGI